MSSALLPNAQVPLPLLKPGWPQSGLECGSRVSFPAGQPSGFPPWMPQPPPRLGARPGAAQGYLGYQGYQGYSCEYIPQFPRPGRAGGVGGRSSPARLGSVAARVGLVSQPGLDVVDPTAGGGVPHHGVGANAASDVVVHRDPACVLPNWRPHHPAVAAHHGRHRHQHQQREHGSILYISPPATLQTLYRRFRLNANSIT